LPFLAQGAETADWPPASLTKPADITQLPADNQHFYRIFALDNNNFGKIVLILHPAIN
jgi:hypothetical protein